MNVIVVILQLKLLRQNIFLLSYKIIVSVKAEYRLNNDSKWLNCRINKITHVYIDETECMLILAE